jgi:hypothetical protein
MTTLTQFAPTVNQNFSFQPTLDGAQYSAIITWSLFGQRWILNVFTLQGVLVLQKPLRGSPLDYDINLIEGYFTTSALVYRVASNNIEVSP